jgi:hypothetical protein
VYVPVMPLAEPGVGETSIDHVLPIEFGTEAMVLPVDNVITDEEFAGNVPEQTNEAACTDVW